MKKKVVWIIIFLLGFYFFYSLIKERDQKQVTPSSEILKKDSELQNKLDTLKTDEVLNLKESEYAYLFDRFDLSIKYDHKFRFGIKEYRLPKVGKEYRLEEVLTQLPDSTNGYGPDFYFMITEDSVSDLIYGRRLEVRKIPINYEHDGEIPWNTREFFNYGLFLLDMYK